MKFICLYKTLHESVQLHAKDQAQRPDGSKINVETDGGRRPNLLSSLLEVRSQCTQHLNLTKLT